MSAQKNLLINKDAEMQAWMGVLRRLGAADRCRAACACSLLRDCCARINVLDVSGGQEALPVLIEGTVETAMALRATVDYSAICWGRQEYNALGGGCDCVGQDCCASGSCTCCVAGLASEAPLECGPACGCAAVCTRRVTQQPVALPLTLVAGAAGWGVRTEAVIPAGVFVCTYAGEMLTSPEAVVRRAIYASAADNYLLTAREHVDGLSTFVVHVDPTIRGNVARWMNHACSPPQCNLASVFARSAGWPVPRIAFFSARRICAGEELRFNYGADDGVDGGGGCQPQPLAAAAAAAARPPAAEVGSRALAALPSIAAQRKRCLCRGAACTGYLPFSSL